MKWNIWYELRWRTWRFPWSVPWLKSLFWAKPFFAPHYSLNDLRRRWLVFSVLCREVYERAFLAVRDGQFRHSTKKLASAARSRFFLGQFDSLGCIPCLFTSSRRPSPDWASCTDPSRKENRVNVKSREKKGVLFWRTSCVRQYTFQNEGSLPTTRHCFLCYETIRMCFFFLKQDWPKIENLLFFLFFSPDILWNTHFWQTNCSSNPSRTRIFDICTKYAFNRKQFLFSFVGMLRHL